MEKCAYDCPFFVSRFEEAYSVSIQLYAWFWRTKPSHSSYQLDSISTVPRCLDKDVLTIRAEKFHSRIHFSSFDALGRRIRYTMRYHPFGFDPFTLHSSTNPETFFTSTNWLIMMSSLQMELFIRGCKKEWGAWCNTRNSNSCLWHHLNVPNQQEKYKSLKASFHLTWQHTTNTDHHKTLYALMTILPSKCASPDQNINQISGCPMTCFEYLCFYYITPHRIKSFSLFYPRFYCVLAVS